MGAYAGHYIGLISAATGPDLVNVRVEVREDIASNSSCNSSATGHDRESVQHRHIVARVLAQYARPAKSTTASGSAALAA